MNSYSIRDDSVYTGLWTDYSDGNRIVTLNVRSAGYLISATTLFVTLVGSCVWSMIRFFVHQRLAGIDKTDGPGLFFRILYRNTGAEIGTIWDIIKICFAWRGSVPRADRIKRRAFVLVLPATANVLIFAAASILSSKIAGRDYESNHVLLKPGNCGMVAWNLGLTGVEYQQRLRLQAELALNDTQAARMYAHNCYRSTSDTAQCSMFPTRYLPYVKDTVDCPFGQDSLGNSLCLPGGNQAFRLTTPLLDTNTMFGVNVPDKDRITMRKSLTCSPIHISSYVRTENQGLDNSTTFLELGPLIGGSSYTTSYKTQSKNLNIGYQLYSIASGAGGIWSPIEALKFSHGDVSINVLAGNSITYLEQVRDPWFSATTNSTTLPYGFDAAYRSDNDLSVLACVDQSQLCNPNTGSSSRCTILGSWAEVTTAYKTIGLNKYQQGIAERIKPILTMASTFTSVNLQGAGALLASRNVMALLSTGLPDDQWQLEVQDWFETALAATQASMVQYVNNVDNTVLGKYATVATFDNGIPENYFCDKQRVRNTGRYVSFSFLGLVVLYSLGSVLVLTSWVLEPMLGWFSKTRSPRSIVRTADQTFQLMRKSLVAAGCGDEQWEKRLTDIPIIGGDRLFWLPKLQNIGDGNDFHPSRPDESRVSQVVQGHNAGQWMDWHAAQVVADKQGRPPQVQVEERNEMHGLMSSPPPELDHRRQRPISSLSEVSALTTT